MHRHLSSAVLGFAAMLTACSSSSKGFNQASAPVASRAIASESARYVVFSDDGNPAEYRSIVYKMDPNGGGAIATCDKNQFIGGVLKDGRDRDILFEKCKIEARFENEQEYDAFVANMTKFVEANPNFGFGVFLYDAAMMGAVILTNRHTVPAIFDLSKAALKNKLVGLEDLSGKGVSQTVRWTDYFGRVFSDTRFYKSTAAAQRAEKIVLDNFRIRSGGTAIFTGVTMLTVIALTGVVEDHGEQNSEHKAVKTVITSFNEAQKVSGAEVTPVSFTAFFRAMNSKEMGYTNWGRLERTSK